MAVESANSGGPPPPVIDDTYHEDVFVELEAASLEEALRLGAVFAADDEEDAG